jgi:hypothetical protein
MIQLLPSNVEMTGPHKRTLCPILKVTKITNGGGSRDDALKQGETPQDLHITGSGLDQAIIGPISPIIVLLLLD